jgi:hypothetical protein
MLLGTAVGLLFGYQPVAAIVLGSPDKIESGEYMFHGFLVFPR